MKKAICTLLIMGSLSLSFASCINDPRIDKTTPKATDNETELKDISESEPAFEDESDMTYTDGLRYMISMDLSSYHVTGMGTATDADVVIPSEYRGSPVTAIAENAFDEEDTLKSVVMRC